MFTNRYLKLGLLGVLASLMAILLMSSAGSTNAEASDEGQPPVARAAADDRYVGSETCAACHEDQTRKVGTTKHGKLHTLDSWKGKIVGCESCHGPGKEHVDGGGDKSKIFSFKNADSKAASESCLTCHAGKEAHNNFRRGEHWRNNIGCVECHSGHGETVPSLFAAKAVEPNLLRRSGQPVRAMLKGTETQLCMSCHTETKAQFSKPFRHKVLEGTMNCSDCHNAHGGFESKQTKLAVGADAACIKCHSNKQGPFVFEHATLKLEGCSSCHTPHGSANPKMLKRSSVRQLCIECHTDILNVELDPEATHGPHSQAVIRGQNCTICHAAIHGSNASRVFFR